jgi:hypothetical protein
MARSKRESTNEIAGFEGLKRPIPAISNAPESKKQTPAQSLRALFTDDEVGAVVAPRNVVIPAKADIQYAAASIN